MADGLAEPARVVAARIRGDVAIWTADDSAEFAGPVAISKMLDAAVAESAWELAARLAAYDLLWLLLIDVVALTAIGIRGVSARRRRQRAA